jgi:hypothetical protein
VCSSDLDARLAGILDAFVSPVIALGQTAEGPYYSLIVARELAAPTPGSESERVQTEFFDPMAHAFIDALATCAPAATRGQVAWGYQFMLGALMHHLSDRRVERLSRGENRAADPAAKAGLLAFLEAGFRGLVRQAAAGKRP